MGVGGGEDERPLVDVVDCSVIYDDLLRQVRVWARLGHSAAEIQAELDARFQPVSDVLDRTLLDQPPPAASEARPIKGYLSM